ncbi:histidine phosphatase family protein [Marinobacteraceae bacterium S3BR75-40.1]
MKTLYVLRHAKSAWKDPDLADIDRPLSARGDRQLASMGAALSALQLPIECVLSSPARRARDTILALANQLPPGRIPWEEKQGLYMADWQALLRLVHGLANQYDHALLCAHNPGLTDFIGRLSDTTLANLPTCGLAAIRFKVECWKQCGDEPGKLQLLLTPKGIQGD